MRFLVFGDLQATDGSELCYTAPNQTLQEMRVTRFFDDVVRLYHEQRCDGIIDCGDTTDDRSAIPMPTLKCIGMGLEKIRLLHGVNFKLTGNHEQYQRDTTVDNRWLFQHAFKVISDREIEALWDFKVFFCAYPKDHAELAKWIKTEAAKVRGRKILFGHFQVKGAYLNNTQTTSGIPLEVLSGFDAVILGHIHQPQSLSERIHYVGSPFQQDWGEADQRKRVIIFDTLQFKLTSVPLTGYPEYRVVSLSDFKQEAQQPSEHRFRVALKDHAESEEFFAHPSFHRAVAHYDYDTDQAEDQGPVPEKDWSFDGILRRYISLVPPAGAGVGLDPDEMLEVGKSIAEPA